MKCADIRNVLLDNKFISDIEIKSEQKYKDKSYSFLVHCKIDVYGEFTQFVIGIPEDWESSLFDFYLYGDFIFMPHVDNHGKLCLFNLEGALIDIDFRGLFNQCVNRAIDLVYYGQSGKNKDDFISEFDSYFALLPNLRHAKVSMPKLKRNQVVKFHEFKSQSKIKKPKTKKADNYQTLGYFASSEPNDFKFWNVNNTQQNGMYLIIEPSDKIYPPNFLEFDSVGFLNELFDWVDKIDFDKIRSKCGRNLFVVFEIQKEKEIISSCAFLIENPVFAELNKVKLRTFDKLFPVLIERIDPDFLSKRTSYTDNLLENKSILLIGAGSIGGYVFYNLIKAGCKNITIVDNDKLKTENIYRHILGAEYTGLYKAEALAKYAAKTLPRLNIKPVDETIQYAIEDCGIEFENYEIIVSATGNHNVNLWINNYIKEKNILTTVFYIWNEALDIGCHVVLTNGEKECDYNVLFERDENGELFDLSSFVMKGQEVSRSFSGCSGTFIPYGSSISLRSSLLFMDLLKKYVEGRIEGNIICSEKGDDFYLVKAGLQTSAVYTKQEDKVIIKPLSEIGKKV